MKWSTQQLENTRPLNSLISKVTMLRYLLILRNSKRKSKKTNQLKMPILRRTKSTLMNSLLSVYGSRTNCNHSLQRWWSPKDWQTHLPLFNHLWPLLWDKWCLWWNKISQMTWTKTWAWKSILTTNWFIRSMKLERLMLRLLLLFWDSYVITAW